MVTGQFLENKIARIFYVFISLICIVFSASSTASNVIDAVVNIEFNKVRAWDDGFNSSGVGTGFVIDAQRGLILTNKHLLNVAPVVAFGEFSNKQTIQLVPVYRDPVHDFGIFQYDPNALDGLDITEIELSDEATVGQSIRLYGNDGGEALSIIEGVLSRLERSAPDYRSTNTDFNTFYFQAALGSSGGSSGSPILNDQNQAIAINAGGRRDTAAAFFLPMQMIIPTVNKLINNEPIRRGSLETVFRFEPYNQLRKIGWDDAKIEQAKSQRPDSNGMLVVEHVVKQSRAQQSFQIGDLLLSINNTAVIDFFVLETILNEQVGKTVEVELERAGSVVRTRLEVSDLFALIPDQFIDYGDTVIIPIGIGTARLFNVPAKGVMVVDPGRLFGSQGIRPLARVDEVNGKPINTLDDLSKELSHVIPGEKFGLRYRYLYELNNQGYTQIRDHSAWFHNKHCKSQLGSLLWQCSYLKKSTDSKKRSMALSTNSVTSPIVDIEVFRPLAVNMNTDVTRRGHGVIVDVEEGLVIADKNIIDSTLSQVHIILNNGRSLPAQVLAVHPYLNMVLVKASLSNIQFAEGVVPNVTATPIDDAAKLIVKSKSFYKDFESNVEVGWPTVSSGDVPFDTLHISLVPEGFSIYIDDTNRLVAIAPAVSNARNSDSVIPSELISRFVSSVQLGEQGLYELKDRFDYISYAQALELGFQEGLDQKAERKISVSKAADLEQSGLKSGDIILMLDDAPTGSLNALHNAVDAQDLNAQILRNGKAQSITLKTKFSSYNKLNEVLAWGGAIIHEIPLNHPTPNGLKDTCIRMGVRYFGAPIYAANASGPFCIYSIDGKQVESLYEFKRSVSTKKMGDYTTLIVIDLDKNYQLSEYRITEDTYYWPTRSFVNTESGWKIFNAPFSD